MNRAAVDALSLIAPLVWLGLVELDVAEPVVDGDDSMVDVSVVVGATDEVDAVAVLEAVVPDGEPEGEDAPLASMVKSGSPAYDCSSLSPDVSVFRSSLEMVWVPVSRPLSPLTVRTSPPSSVVATEILSVPHWVSGTAGK